MTAPAAAQSDMTTSSSVTVPQPNAATPLTAVDYQTQLNALHETCRSLQCECNEHLRQNQHHRASLDQIHAKWQRKLVRQQQQQAATAAAERARYQRTLQLLQQTIDETRAGYERQLADIRRQLPQEQQQSTPPRVAPPAVTPTKDSTKRPHHKRRLLALSSSSLQTTSTGTPPPAPQTVTLYSSSDNDDDDGDERVSSCQEEEDHTDRMNNTTATATVLLSSPKDDDTESKIESEKTNSCTNEPVAVSSVKGNSIPEDAKAEHAQRKFELEYDLASIQERYTMDPDQATIAGGFSSVFLAKALATGADVAIKYCPHVDSTPLMIEREVSALERFRGVPGLCQLREHWTGRYGTFIVMDRCPGQDVERMVVAAQSKEQPHPFDAAACRVIARQLFTVLAHMHAQHVIHRDIKPANLMLHYRRGGTDATTRISTTLVDLGVCYVLTPGLTLKNASGTPGYWAPEVHDTASPYHSKGYDTAADMYSAGCTLYYIMRGVPLHSTDGDGCAPPEPQWDSMTYWLQHLLQNLTQLDPKARLTAEQVLQHPFVAGSGWVPVARIRLRALHTLCMAHSHYVVIALAFLLVAQCSPPPQSLSA